MKSTERTRREWSKMLQESMKDVEYGDENTLEIKHRMKYTNKWQTEIKQKGCVAEGKKTSFSNLKPDLRVHYTDRTFKVKCNWNKTAKQRNQYVFRDDGNFVNSRQHIYMIASWTFLVLQYFISICLIFRWANISYTQTETHHETCILWLNIFAEEVVVPFVTVSGTIFWSLHMFLGFYSYALPFRSLKHHSSVCF